MVPLNGKWGVVCSRRKPADVDPPCLAQLSEEGREFRLPSLPTRRRLIRRLVLCSFVLCGVVLQVGSWKRERVLRNELRGPGDRCSTEHCGTA